MATITFHSTEAVDQAIADLMERGGYREKSSAIRDAIMKANRQSRIDRLRAETAALAADPVDRAEVKAIHEEMESLRAW